MRTRRRNNPHELAEALSKAAKIVRHSRQQRAKRRRTDATPTSKPRRGPDTWNPKSSSSASVSSGDSIVEPPDIVVAPPPPRPVDPPVEVRDWLRVETELAVFELDPYSGNIGCRCKHPEHKDEKLLCRVNKMRTKCPAGYFLAWLLDADNHRGRTSHFASRLWKEVHPQHTDVTSYEKRVLGRAFALARPEYRPFLDWEIPKNMPEPMNV